MFNIFSKEAVNKGRQIELDIARGLAVLFMVLIHIQEYFSSNLTKDAVVGRIIDFLGGIPAAPVFMFLLGIGIVYTSKSDYRIFIKRGFWLILAGYILNFIRGTLPSLFDFWLSKDLSYLNYGLKQMIYVDIFHFAGLAMIVFGLIKKMNIGKITLLLLLIILGAVNYLVTVILTQNYLIGAFTALIWGSNELSFFPFLSWIFYPVAGYIWGQYLIRCSNKNIFYSLNLIISLVVMVGLYYLFNNIIHLENGLSSDFAYYHHKLNSNIEFTFFVIAWISIIFFISKIIPNIIYKHIERWSKNVSEIYFIHWVLIGWIGIIIKEKLSQPLYWILFLLLFIVSDYLSDYYSMLEKIKKNSKLANNKTEETKNILNLNMVLYFMFIVVLIVISNFIIIKTDITSNKVEVGNTVFIKDSEEQIWYPAKIKKINGVDRYLVSYYDNSISEENIDIKEMWKPDKLIGLTVQIYDEKNKLSDALIVEENGKNIKVKIDEEIEEVDFGDILIKNKEIKQK